MKRRPPVLPAPDADGRIKVDLVVPGAVWDTCLDPSVTGIPKERGFPEPEHRKVGKGSQAVYRQIDLAVVRDILDCVQLICDGIVGYTGPGEDRRERAALRWVTKMWDIYGEGA